MLVITKQTPLKVVLEVGKECDKCNNCCKHDSGIVLDEDIPRIAKSMNLSEKKFKETYLFEHERFNTACYKFKQEKQIDEKTKNKKPYGKCIMLHDELGCMIHNVKPLHCKVCSVKSKHGEALTQWFALNYLVNINNPESIRQWATFLQFQTSIQGGELKDLIPDKQKLNKILNYELLK